jgi:hypothetical protein
VDIDDRPAVVAAWGPCAGCAADLDSDRYAGIEDLLTVLSNWG